HPDAQQPVIWNIGAIAGCGHPRALDTIRRVLLASSAIPAALPPVMIDVSLDGERRQEMHVDGGAFVQTFLYPVALTEARPQKLARGGGASCAPRPMSSATADSIQNGPLSSVARWVLPAVPSRP